MISKQTLLSTLKDFKKELNKIYKLDQTIIAINEIGNATVGKAGQILQSNGDGTYSWTDTVKLGKFYIQDFSGSKNAFIYEIGMTWQEFINSNCNTEYVNSDGKKCMLSIGEYGIHCASDMYYDVKSSDVIINGHTYEPFLVVEMPMA